MWSFLFRGLTAEPDRGAALFAAIVVQARQPHWYVEGQVPDTVDGRFRVLATLTALALVRIESEGDSGNPASVALTERFIEVMETEHRELGLGDPKLGRTVRKLVGALSRRVALWRELFAGPANAEDWGAVARQSLYHDDPEATAVRYAARVSEDYWERLQRTALPALMDGRMS